MPLDDVLERALLEASSAPSGEQELDELARTLGASLAAPARPGGVRLGGLAIHEPERGQARYFVLELGAHAGQDAGAPLVIAADGELEPEALEPAERELTDRTRHPLHRALVERGARHVVAAPIPFGDRVLGQLFVAVEGAESLAPAAGEFLDRLARVVAPRVFNSLTHERFARGDRRRDALVELSRVINTSLDAEIVLDRARRAIGTIQGHAFSWIAILEPEGGSFRRHDRPAEYGGATNELVSVHDVEGSVVAKLLETSETYVSGDLSREARFLGDDELSEAGVGRYIATPLRAGGKVLGAFLFGASDRLRPLPVDVWLIENVALQLALAIDNANQHGEIQRLSRRRAQENVYLREEIQREHNFGEMVGRSPALLAVCANIERVARTDSTVLVNGPTGVGKELVARAIHAASRVADQPMVKLNCAAIAEGMVESELFGHERGAFTSAVEKRIGRFELAQEGTLFLDEIGELPLGVQTKLLRVLQDGEFERVGGTKTLKSHARIIAATNRDLGREVERGNFRSDLYYRLNVFPIELPSLEDRREDIPLLADFFLDQFARSMGKTIQGIAPESLDRLCRRPWPGNVRELKHVIERAVILNDGAELVIDDDAPGGRTEPLPGPTSGPPIRTLKEMEAHHIRRALEASEGVIEGPRGAAQALGMKSSTLRFRMKRLGVERPGAARRG